ncbi:MAG: MotA/TolQ/ExbB proton channel family protein [bacterium]|nr:MotA/TolQ/ExbB proton channel family protein [bacterium]
MSGLSILVAVLFAVACGASGAVGFLWRARRLRVTEAAYGIATPGLPHMAVICGALTGAVVGFLVLYFAAYAGGFHPVEWIGRASYLLVAASVGMQFFFLLRLSLLIRHEEQGWGARPPVDSLGARRRERLTVLRARFRHYTDLKTRDDEVVAEILGVIGTPLLNARRDQSRLPFYGYLGTVAGILLMAEELGRITEATETFKVLASMATGLVLAFQTTLVALVAFLPLRKYADHLVQRLAAIEEKWLAAREEGQE